MSTRAFSSIKMYHIFSKSLRHCFAITSLLDDFEFPFARAHTHTVTSYLVRLESHPTWHLYSSYIFTYDYTVIRRMSLYLIRHLMRSPSIEHVKKNITNHP